MEPLAHSGRVARGIGPQTYAKHILAVRNFATHQMEEALRFRSKNEPALETSVAWASEFHDLGKLEEGNQFVLRTKERGGLPINHVDAGVAHLGSIREIEAAIAVYGHHVGLCNIPEEMAKDQRSRQDPAEAACRDYKIKLATDARLPQLAAKHREAVRCDPSFADYLKSIGI